MLFRVYYRRIKYKNREVNILNEITAITPQVKDKTRCNIYVDGRFCCG